MKMVEIPKNTMIKNKKNPRNISTIGNKNIDEKKGKRNKILSNLTL